MEERLLIHNRDLRPADVPDSDAGFDALNKLAISYPGYSVWGDLDVCWETGKRDWDRLEGGDMLPASVTKLRTCLFTAARAAHMTSEGDEEERQSERAD